ncbi:ribose-5-phosphate isomerase [Scopulibacillus darangshiensis]|uniref:Ribose-5-phosphate isomerase A n=1 Tax=Scopulibacillus darangshiensis TaxID=442528 RepID=A0A4R2P3G3_9BACL|nr:ribose-5-phosphate isomerase RpiA [Scopulibacillus darangshiensis]TCP29233.1 ribose-5-phosphate isomerase [Scopulibacillus darangshiensis]
MDRKSYEKQLVGERAADYIRDGMIVGLGTGSTIAFTIKKLGERLKRETLNITCVSTSNQTSELAKSLGIPMKELNEVSHIDLTIDGVDEFDPQLNGIKGGGGALLFEKIVAKASKSNIWVADGSKEVDILGAFPLPVEVLPFGSQHTARAIREKGLDPKLRMDGENPYRTDSRNFILDCHIGKITEPERLSQWLNALPGVIENGLFINIVGKVLIPEGDNDVKVIGK